MAVTRSKKSAKKVHTRTRKPVLPPKPKVTPKGKKTLAKKSPAKKTPVKKTSHKAAGKKPAVKNQLDSDENIMDSLNDMVDDVDNLADTLPITPDTGSTSFWKCHRGDLAVLIESPASFDASKYKTVKDELPMVTPPFKKVRFNHHVQEIDSSGTIDRILNRAIFNVPDYDESDEASSRGSDEDLLAETVHQYIKTRAQRKAKGSGFEVVIPKSLSSSSKSPAPTPTPAGSGRVTRHTSTTHHQFRLAVTGDPSAISSSELRSAVEGLSIRASIHSRIDEKASARRTRSAGGHVETAVAGPSRATTASSGRASTASSSRPTTASSSRAATATASSSRAATPATPGRKVLATLSSPSTGNMANTSKTLTKSKRVPDVTTREVIAESPVVTKRSSPRFARASKAVIVQINDDGEEEEEETVETDESEEEEEESDDDY